PDADRVADGDTGVIDLRGDQVPAAADGRVLDNDRLGGADSDGGNVRVVAFPRAGVRPALGNDQRGRGQQVARFKPLDRWNARRVQMIWPSPSADVNAIITKVRGWRSAHLVANLARAENAGVKPAS